MGYTDHKSQNPCYSTTSRKRAIICVFHFSEIEMGTHGVVEMTQQQTILHQPPTLDKMER